MRGYLPGGKWFWVKRCMDLLVAIPALICLAPVLGVVALVVRRSMGSPVFFRQQRPGFGGRPFLLMKFRTMSNDRDANGRLLPDDVRLGRVGKILRRYSLDELPQLLNVVRGEMSLVGPRPLLMRYLDRYTPEQARRHEVLPGITGWSQIHGRNATSWEAKFTLDVWYVDHCSPALDLRILGRTVAKVLKAEGVMEEGGAVYSEYWGAQGPPKGGAVAYPADEVEARTSEPAGPAALGPESRDRN